MDQRFEGDSRAPLTPFSYEMMGGDQLAVLNTLGAPSAHLIADSLHCSQALHLIYEASARINSAVLVRPAGLGDANTMDAYLGLFRETIRVARADGLQGVVAAALKNPDFTANPGGGPWARRLFDEPAFRDTLLSIGRETYITLIVDFRDGMFPWDRWLFGINDAALARIHTPIGLVTGDDELYPPDIAGRICTEAPNAQWIDRDADRTGVSDAIVEFLKLKT